MQNVRLLEVEGELQSETQRQKGWLGGRSFQDLGAVPESAKSASKYVNQATALLLALETQSGRCRLGNRKACPRSIACKAKVQTKLQASSLRLWGRGEGGRRRSQTSDGWRRADREAGSASWRT